MSATGSFDDDDDSSGAPFRSGSTDAFGRVQAGWSRANTVVSEPWASMVDTTTRWREWIIDLPVIAVVVGAVLLEWLRPWRTSLRSPLVYEGDWHFYAMNVKTIIQTGWMQSTDRLGAPYGQELYDFPLGGDNGNFVIIKILSWFSGDFSLVLNAFFLVGFASVSVTSYVAFRFLKVGRLTAIVAAIVYTLAPYHFIRHQHILLAHYAVIPVGLVLALRAASGQSFFTSGHPRRHVLGWATACIVVGSFGVYFAVFSVISIAVCAMIVAVAARTARPIVAASAFGATIAAVMVANLASSILYWREHGSNAAVGSRVAIETDIFGLRLIQMVSPVPGTRLPVPTSVTATLAEGYQGGSSMFLGVVSAIFLLGSLLWLVPQTVRRESRPVAPLASLTSLSIVFWLLVASTGGLNWVVWLAGFQRIRDWGRSSIVAQFLALLWACSVVPAVVSRWSGRLDRWRRPMLVAVGAFVVLIAIVDQATPAVQARPGAHEAAWASDRDFFAGIEADLPLGAAVAQLPIRRFPEELPRVRSGDYDLVRPFLHTNDLRWSYGGMKGRESDWQLAVVNIPTRDVVEAFVAFGFEALVIDRYGYEDEGAALEQDLSTILGVTPRASPDGRWAYFPLAGSPSGLGRAELDVLRAELEAAAVAS